MNPRRTSPARAGAVIVLAAVALAGCGEIKNTIKPKPNSANQVTVALPGAPNAFEVGLYEAQARGYFAQSDLHVRLRGTTGAQDPVTMVHDRQVLVGVSSEPDVLLHRNEDEPVVGVAALVQAPLPAITIQVPKAGASGGAAVTTRTTRAGTRTRTTHRRATHTTTSATGRTTTAPTTTTVREPEATLWPLKMQQLLSQPGAPTYDGLVIVVRKGTIVQHAGLVRRFVQAVARGYRAARADPSRAINDLVNAVPSLAPKRGLQRATLNAAIPYFFPTDLKVWGWQQQEQWNALGTWMTRRQLLSNPNAITDASTNELLQGQGV